MLAFCIIRFSVGYTLPDWASWMIWFGFDGQTIALIFLLAILPEIRVYAPREFFTEWMDPDRPRDHRLTEFINFTELHRLNRPEACIKYMF